MTVNEATERIRETFAPEVADEIIEALSEPLLNVKILKPDDKEYPWHIMGAVYEAHKKYTLMSVDGVVVVPLYQVISKISDSKIPAYPIGKEEN